MRYFRGKKTKFAALRETNLFFILALQLEKVALRVSEVSFLLTCIYSSNLHFYIQMSGTNSMI